jgi:hypothetical protein
VTVLEGITQKVVHETAQVLGREAPGLRASDSYVEHGPGFEELEVQVLPHVLDDGRQGKGLGGLGKLSLQPAYVGQVRDGAPKALDGLLHPFQHGRHVLIG